MYSLENCSKTSVTARKSLGAMAKGYGDRGNKISEHRSWTQARCTGYHVREHSVNPTLAVRLVCNYGGNDTKESCYGAMVARSEDIAAATHPLYDCVLQYVPTSV